MLHRLFRIFLLHFFQNNGFHWFQHHLISQVLFTGQQICKITFGQIKFHIIFFQIKQHNNLIFSIRAGLCQFFAFIHYEVKIT